jgi:hypothetical protein
VIFQSNRGERFGFFGACACDAYAGLWPHKIRLAVQFLAALPGIGGAVGGGRGAVIFILLESSSVE